MMGSTAAQSGMNNIRRMMAMGMPAEGTSLKELDALIKHASDLHSAVMRYDGDPDFDSGLVAKFANYKSKLRERYQKATEEGASPAKRLGVEIQSRLS